MIKYLWRITRAPIFIYRNAVSRTVLYKMSKSPDKTVRDISLSLTRTFKHKNMSGKGKLNEIENLRQNLIRCNNVIDSPINQNELKYLANIVSKNKLWSVFIFLLGSRMKFKNCLELGTCIGISACYIAESLNESQGLLYTIEGDKGRAMTAQLIFNKLKYDNIKLINDNFDNIFSLFENKKIKFDFIFIDGDHHFNSLTNLYRQMTALMNDGCLLIYDDINYSREMRKFWKWITNRPEFDLSVDLFQLGILRYRTVELEKSCYKLAMPTTS